MTSIGFLGSGSMVRAMARGWAAAGKGPGRMLFTDSGSGRAAEIAAEVGGEAVAGNRELAERCDLLVLGCKPKDLGAAAAEAGSAGLILSLLGATPLHSVQTAFPASEVHRVMPNVAVEVGQGVLCLAEAEGARRGDVRELLEDLGEVFDVADSDLDAATAVMGCSPAYMDLLVESLGDSGVRAGLDTEVSRRMAQLTLRGTAALMASRRPGEIRDAVASAGGSTEAGLESLREDRFESVIERAVAASLARMRGEA